MEAHQIARHFARRSEAAHGRRKAAHRASTRSGHLNAAHECDESSQSNHALDFSAATSGCKPCRTRSLESSCTCLSAGLRYRLGLTEVNSPTESVAKQGAACLHKGVVKVGQLVLDTFQTNNRISTSSKQHAPHFTKHQANQREICKHPLCLRNGLSNPMSCAA